MLPSKTQCPRKSVDTSSWWLDAIQSATQGLFPAGGTYGKAAAAADPEASLDYLQILLTRLEKISQLKWNEVPHRRPPRFGEPQQQDDTHPQLYPTPSQAGSGFSTTNPFAAFQQDESSSSDDDDDEEAGEPTQDPLFDPEAGDTIVQEKTKMVIRRLVLRILASQSDVHGRLADQARFGTNNSDNYNRGNNQNRQQQQQQPNWRLGAGHLSQAVQVLHRAVILADEPISQQLQLQEQQQPQQQAAAKLEQLQEDAQVIAIALSHYSRKEERFRKAAQGAARRLERILEPQWSTRDEVKQRIGEDLWNNNPNPKYDYARLRQQDEAEWRELQQALAALEDLERTTEQLQASVEQLQSQSAQLMGQQQKRDGVHDTSADTTSNYHRYNGQRPTTLQQRVSWEDYPDPTTFGWTFTGSHEPSRVEFFEKMSHEKKDSKNNSQQRVKLDWFYTTGTIKTSLDHPRQGHQQLFGARVTPDNYISILQNPRAHTNVRYHTKTKKTRGGGGKGDRERGSGRSRRGRSSGRTGQEK